MFVPYEDENTFVDLTSPMTSLFYPLMEAIAATGLAWMAIGYIDAHNIDPRAHNALVAFWAFVILWRLILPAITTRRRRIIVTDYRVYHRSAGWFAEELDIPLDDIDHVERGRGALILHRIDHGRPYIIHKVPKNRAVVRRINELLGIYTG